MKIKVKYLCGGMLRPRTVEDYERIWKMYLEFAQTEEKALRPNTFRDWRTHLIENTEYARKTIDVYLMHIRSVVTHAYNAGIVDEAVFDGFRSVRCLRKNALPGRGNLRPPTRIEPAEMRAICDAAKPNPDDPLEAYRRAIVLLLASSGMRISEAAKLKIADIAQEGEGQYIIRNYAGKGGVRRDIPLSAEAYEAIQDWLFQRPVNSEYVFNGLAPNEIGCHVWADNHANRHYLGSVIRETARRAGVKNVKPHDFRRFVGTQLARKDIRLAQKVLGHSSIELTQRLYILDRVPAGATNDLF